MKRIVTALTLSLSVLSVSANATYSYQCQDENGEVTILHRNTPLHQTNDKSVSDCILIRTSESKMVYPLNDEGVPFVVPEAGAYQPPKKVYFPPACGKVRTKGCQVYPLNDDGMPFVVAPSAKY